MSSIDIDMIRVTEVVQETSDEFTKSEEEDWDKEQKKACLTGLKQDIEQRKQYANNIFVFVVAWSICAAMVIVCSGVGILKLSDAVLIGIVSGTTVNALGLLAIVVNYLFPTPRNTKESSSSFTS